MKFEHEDDDERKKERSAVATGSLHLHNTDAEKLHPLQA